MEDAVGAIIATIVAIALALFLLFLAVGLATIIVAFLGLFIAKASGGLRGYRDLQTALIIVTSFAVACTAALWLGSLFAHEFMSWFLTDDRFFRLGDRHFEANLYSSATTFFKDILFALACVVATNFQFKSVGKATASLVFSAALLFSNFSSILIVNPRGFDFDIVLFPLDPLTWISAQLEVWASIALSFLDTSKWMQEASRFVLSSGGNLFLFETLIGAITAVWGFFSFLLGKKGVVPEVDKQEADEWIRLLGYSALIAVGATLLIAIPFPEGTNFFLVLCTIIFGILKLASVIVLIGSIIVFVFSAFGALLVPKG